MPLKENDPNSTSGNAQSNMRPDFLRTTDKQKAAEKSKNAAASNQLKSLEQSSVAPTAGNLAQKINPVNLAQNSEEQGAAGFVNSTGQSQSKTKSKKGKKAAIGFIFGLILIASVATMGSQATRPFAFVSNIMQNYDATSYSTTARLKTTLRSMKAGTTKVSKETKELLEKVGINLDVDDNDYVKNISYEAKDGTIKNVTDLDNVDAEFNSKVAKAAELQNNASYYDSEAKLSAKKRIGVTGNLFEDMDDGSSKNKTDAEIEEDFNNKMNGNVDTGVETEKSKMTAKDSNGDDVEVFEFEDEDGNIKYRTADGAEVDSDTVKKITVTTDGTRADTGQKLKDIATFEGSDSTNTKMKTNVDVDGLQSKVDAAGKVTGTAAAFVCAFSGVATAIVTVTMAQQIMDMIGVASPILEATQKVQAGVGDGTSFNMVNEKTSQTTGEDGDNGFWGAAAVLALFGGNTASTKSTANLESTFTDLDGDSTIQTILADVGNIGSTIEAWQACNVAKIVDAGVSLASDIAACFSFGLTKVIQAAVSAAVAGTVAYAMSIIVPKLLAAAAKALLPEVIGSILGAELGGDYAVAGANAILNKTSQSIGLSAGTGAKVAAFQNYSASVIADRAQYDRDNLSPFDTSSKYTFLGSLKYSLTQFSVLSTGNSLVRSVKAAGSVLSSSINALLPSALATTYSPTNGLFSTGEESEQVCPYLESVGASGSYNSCNETIIADVDSFDITYEEAVEYLCYTTGDLTNCESGSPTITKNSELAKYVSYWTMRDTHLGLADANATSNLGSTGNSTADGVISSLPFVGSIKDIADTTIDVDNQTYIFGSEFVAGGSEWGDDQRYFQAYLEMDTMYESLGLIETSALATFINEYYQENPLDTSYEGTLARFSGMTKDQVIATLDYMDYLDYLANYDPSDRYSFVHDEEIVEQKIEQNNYDNIYLANSVFPTDIAYYDVRNRSFAI